MELIHRESFDDPYNRGGRIRTEHLIFKGGSREDLDEAMATESGGDFWNLLQVGTIWIATVDHYPK